MSDLELLIPLVRNTIRKEGGHSTRVIEALADHLGQAQGDKVIVSKVKIMNMLSDMITAGHLYFVCHKGARVYATDGSQTLDAVTGAQ